METDFGLISIIMAAYNAEKSIQVAVDSVLQQTYVHFELLIVDDCSTDSTPSIVKEMLSMDTRIKYIRMSANSGVSAARYRGLLESKGDWVAILDSDDVWVKTKLEKQIIRQKESHAELLFTGSCFIDENGVAYDAYLSAPLTVGYKSLLKQNVISNSSSLVKKELYRKFYAKGDNMHEDFATWLAILRTGRIAYGIDEPLLIYRVASSSKSGNKFKSAKMNWNTYRYIGLNSIKAFYYMICYSINGIIKYRKLIRKP